MVLNTFDHDSGLLFEGGHHEFASVANAGMGDIAVACNLVGCINDEYVLLLGQNFGDLTDNGGLSCSWLRHESFVNNEPVRQKYLEIDRL